MNQLQDSNDLLRLIDQHRFHNPLTPRACYICRVEGYRAENTPTVRWSRAIKAAVRPPTPVAIMLAVIAAQAIALAVILA